MTTTLRALLEAVPSLRCDSGADVLLLGATLDSRRVGAGFLFAALPGRHVHGSAFAAEAVAAGAAAILTDPAGQPACLGAGVPVLVHSDPRSVLGAIAALVYGLPAERLAMAGVTGTNGKTTVTYLIAEGLRACGLRTGVIGTTGVVVGDTVIDLERTTPEAPDLQALLAGMVEEGVQAVAMEVSSIALAEHRIDGIEFAAAAFTNLSQDHLDYHGDMESYFAAKAMLFGRTRRAIVCIDDQWGARLAVSTRLELPTATYGIEDPAADWFGRIAGDGTVHVAGPRGLRCELRLSLPGRFNAANAVGALAVLDALGVDPSAAADALGRVRVPGRMERVEVAGAPLGIVDYAHSPDAITRVLQAARLGGRVIAVIGAGGDRDREKRPLMGRSAAELADLVIVTDDNPRSEDPAEIRAAVVAGAGASAVEIADRAEAIRHAVGEADPGDVVVVLGKGHEQGQERMGEVSPFDDRAVLRDALLEWAAR